MKLEVYTESDAFEILKPEWNELLERSLSNTIFSTWEWQSTWWNVYQPGELLIITCRDDNNRLVGIAPWFIDDNRNVSFVGCIDVTDYLDVIIDENHFDIALEGFARILFERVEMYDAIRLCNIPEGSSTPQTFSRILGNCSFSTKIEQIDVSPRIELPDTFDDYLALMDKKYRHELRRKLRRARGASEHIEDYTVNSSHNLDDEIERFLTLMAESDEEKSTFLQDAKNVSFFKQLIPVLFEKGWLQLNFLTISGEVVAAYFNFVYNNHVLVYNSGQQHGKYDHLSPGIVLLANNIEAAINDKYEVFDFLRGDEPYKYHLGGKDKAIYMLTAQLS